MKSLTKYLAMAAVMFVAAITVHAQVPASAPPSTSAMAQKVAAYDTQVQEDAQYMAHLQALARKAKDVVKLTCVNDRMVELKAQRNLFDTSHQAFDIAITNSADAAQPSYVELGGTAAAVKKLRGDAEACVGVLELLYEEKSDVQVSHPLFPDDPTQEDPFLPEVEPPAYASPFA
jgi:hypothetical protein